jgi:hypothetical protein
MGPPGKEERAELRPAQEGNTRPFGVKKKGTERTGLTDLRRPGP